MEVNGISTGYRCIRWMCPYFLWDKKQEVHCEAGVCKFKDMTTYLYYVQRYCAGDEWKNCTQARALNLQYDTEI